MKSQNISPGIETSFAELLIQLDWSDELFLRNQKLNLGELM